MLDSRSVVAGWLFDRSVCVSCSCCVCSVCPSADRASPTRDALPCLSLVARQYTVCGRYTLVYGR